jgi:hypothetical protein
MQLKYRYNALTLFTNGHVLLPRPSFVSPLKSIRFSVTRSALHKLTY